MSKVRNWIVGVITETFKFQSFYVKHLCKVSIFLSDISPIIIDNIAIVRAGTTRCRCRRCCTAAAAADAAIAIVIAGQIERRR